MPASKAATTAAWTYRVSMYALPRLPWFTRALPENDDSVGLHVVPVFPGSIGPLDDQAPHVRILPEPEMEANVAGAQVARIGVHPSPERFFAVPHNCDT